MSKSETLETPIDPVESLSVFWSTDCGLEDFVGILSRSVGVRFVDMSDANDQRFTARLLGFELICFDEHELEDEEDVPFSAYSIQLEVVSLETGVDLLVHSQLRRCLAQFVMRHLAKYFGCSGMVVRNLRKVIDRTD